MESSRCMWVSPNHVNKQKAEKGVISVCLWTRIKISIFSAYGCQSFGLGLIAHHSLSGVSSPVLAYVGTSGFHNHENQFFLTSLPLSSAWFYFSSKLRWWSLSDFMSRDTSAFDETAWWRDSCWAGTSSRTGQRSGPQGLIMMDKAMAWFGQLSSAEDRGRAWNWKLEPEDVCLGGWVKLVLPENIANLSESWDGHSQFDFTNYVTGRCCARGWRYCTDLNTSLAVIRLTI